jgi:hypothetical protein
MKKGVTIIDCLMLFALLLMILLASCTSTKQVVKQTTSIDSSYIKQLEESVRVLQSENSHLSSEIHEMLFNSVEFDSTNCPPTQIIIDERCNADSIRAILEADFSNEVKIHANGTIEAKGQLRRASASLQKIQQVIAEQSRTIDSLRSLKQHETVRTITKTEYKDKYVKTSFLSQWWLFPAGMLCMALIFYRKKVKSFLT